jgi:hypothetical protein
MNVIKALELYQSLHWMRSAPGWGDVLLNCTCETYYGNALCTNTLLLAGVFNPEIRVQDDCVGATQALRKQCKSLKGTAGRKRPRIAQEKRAYQKKMPVYQLPFLCCPQTVKDAAASFVNLTSSDSEQGQV